MEQIYKEIIEKVLTVYAKVERLERLIENIYNSRQINSNNSRKRPSNKKLK